MRSKICIAILVIILFSSCAHEYVQALYHQDIAYQPKPASFDSVKSMTYISAGGAFYTNTNYTDGLTSGQVNISQAYVFKNFNLAYGAFGVAGDYSNSHNTDNSSGQASINDFNDKFFDQAFSSASSSSCFS
jgi:hypothetical protein